MNGHLMDDICFNSAYEMGTQGEPYWALQRVVKKNISNYSYVGLVSKAKNAAFVNSSKRDPDVDDCILNQKLQYLHYFVLISFSSFVANQSNSNLLID
jgi:hypothetical protein